MNFKLKFYILDISFYTIITNYKNYFMKIFYNYKKIYDNKNK